MEKELEEVREDFEQSVILNAFLDWKYTKIKDYCEENKYAHKNGLELCNDILAIIEEKMEDWEDEGMPISDEINPFNKY